MKYTVDVMSVWWRYNHGYDYYQLILRYPISHGKDYDKSGHDTIIPS